jgi:hypothetical protein
MAHITYSKTIEKQMKAIFGVLSERDRRMYAAVEANKLQRGGITYISELLGCSTQTILQGNKDLLHGSIEPGRIRKPGGGRKTAQEKYPELDDIFLKVLKDHTAGDPMDDKVQWTDLSNKEIRLRIAKKGIHINKNIVARLLKNHGYSKCRMIKSKAIGSSENRNEQFENIANLKKKYTDSGQPVISMDTKKKELIGNLHRAGAVYCQQAIEVYDHDFPHLADGIAIPHGIYDINLNTGYVNIGTSRDTSEFSCDSLRHWWYNRGRYDYPEATELLILADGGGSNGCRHYVFKKALQDLADSIGLEIRMAHYPPYTSKWNPIEHRLFPHITRSLSGIVLKDHELVKHLIKKTTTEFGLKVKANIIDKVYEIGKKVSNEFKGNMKIVFDDYLPLWNYTAACQK